MAFLVGFSLMGTHEVIRCVKLKVHCKDCPADPRIEYMAVPTRANAEDVLAREYESQFVAPIEDTVEIKLYGVKALGLIFQRISYDKYLVLRIHDRQGHSAFFILFVDETALRTQTLAIELTKLE